MPKDPFKDLQKQIKQHVEKTASAHFASEFTKVVCPVHGPLRTRPKVSLTSKQMDVPTCCEQGLAALEAAMAKR